MSTGFDSIKRSLLEASEHAKEQAASQSRTRHAPRDTSYDDHLWQALADPKEAAAYLDAVMLQKHLRKAHEDRGKRAACLAGWVSDEFWLREDVNTG
jgi:hypothetical protein